MRALVIIFALALKPALVLALDAKVELNLVDESGIGKSIGIIEAHDSNKGLVLVPNLHGLPPGEHGFHVHENGSCLPGEKDGKMVAALSAGGHLDPTGSGRHEGPNGSGHLGDLPALRVADDGTATQYVIAPRLKVEDIKNRSIMIHAGGDNYADTPSLLGGGGARMACGVVG